MKTKKKPDPLGPFLEQCRYALVGSVIKAAYFFHAVARREEVLGLPGHAIELQAFLSFLGRAHDLLASKVPPDASPELKAQAADFAVRMRPARILRNMVEHPTGYEQGAGGAQEHFEKVAPGITMQSPAGGPKVQMDGEMRSRGPNGFIALTVPMSISGILVGQAMVANRLDMGIAVQACREVLEVVERDLRVVASKKRATAPGKTGGETP